MPLEILPIIEETRSQPFTPKLPNHEKVLNGFYLNSNLQLIKKIGAGTYGLIYLVKDIKTHRHYATKIILKESLSLHQKDVDAYKKYIQEKVYYEFIGNSCMSFEELDLELLRQSGGEVPYLKELSIHLKCHSHPNVATIHKVLNFPSGIIMLMDYFPQGDLFKNIVENQIFQKNQMMMKNCILQIINVIKYLKLKNIYHCDLKPENIMVKYNPNYRRLNNSNLVDYNEIQIGLIDFGLSIEEEYICCNSCRGSLFYMSPERIVNYPKNDYISHNLDLSSYKINPKDELMYFPTIKGDIWSIGVLLINITCARNPWPNASIVPNNNDVFQSYLNKEHSVLRKILPISHEFNNLLNQIFQLNPVERIDLSLLYTQILTVDFFHDQLLSPPESPEM